ALRTLGSRGAANLHDAVFYAARAVAQLCSDLAGNFGDLLHDTGQHANPIAQQTAVGGIVNVGLDHGSVDAHLCPLAQALLPGNAHDSVVDLFDHLRPYRHAPFAHGLGIGHLGHPDVRELAVDEIGAHLPLEHGVAPVARVLENEQTNDHFGAKAAPTARAAQAMAFGQRFVRGHHNSLVRQHLVGVDHPRLVEAVDLFGDQLVTKRELRAPRVDHVLFLARFTGVSSGRSKLWLSSQISSSASLRLL